MDHGNPPASQSAHVPEMVRPPDKLPIFQQAFLLEQLVMGGPGGLSVGELNKKITASVRRELQLSADVANRIRAVLAEQGYLEAKKIQRTLFYGLSDAGRAYLARLERPTLSGQTKQPLPVEESTITDELREAQKAYLLLQLLDADGQPLTKSEANKIHRSLSIRLGLKPAVANYRREKLVEQGYVQMTRKGRSDTYTLTRDGLDYLVAGVRQLDHAEIRLKGKTLNALIAAARESSFERDRHEVAPWADRPLPSAAELADATLAVFQDLRRERHGRSGLVPIHEVRQRIADQFGPATARHDVLDDVILGLWREHRLSLEAISDLGDATEQQLNDSIQGANGTLFYLEVPREQPVAF